VSRWPGRVACGPWHAVPVQGAGGRLCREQAVASAGEQAVACAGSRRSPLQGAGGRILSAAGKTGAKPIITGFMRSLLRAAVKRMCARHVTAARCCPADHPQFHLSITDTLPGGWPARRPAGIAGMMSGACPGHQSCWVQGPTEPAPCSNACCRLPAIPSSALMLPAPCTAEPSSALLWALLSRQAKPVVACLQPSPNTQPWRQNRHYAGACYSPSYLHLRRA
jgi:hypothetical protein